MNPTTRSTILTLALVFSIPVRADHPAFEYFVVKTKRIPIAVKTDADFQSMTSSQLEEISEVHGWLESLEKCSVSFSSENFRLDLRTSSAFPLPNTPKVIDYLISAGGSHDWSIVATNGQAIQIGSIYLTRTWRAQPVLVIFRPINLKR